MAGVGKYAALPSASAVSETAFFFFSILSRPPAAESSAWILTELCNTAAEYNGLIPTFRAAAFGSEVASRSAAAIGAWFVTEKLSAA
jgi:hypothetical protein